MVRVAPTWAKDAVLTTKGWRSKNGKELLVSMKVSEEEVAEWEDENRPSKPAKKAATKKKTAAKKTTKRKTSTKKKAAKKADTPAPEPVEPVVEETVVETPSDVEFSASVLEEVAAQDVEDDS